MACIVRIDNGRTRGWQARAYTVAPRYVSKLFSDRKLGGQTKAYAAALEATTTLERQARRLAKKARAGA